MRYLPSSQLPRSTMRQRSEQNGKLFASGSTAFLHVGQLTFCIIRSQRLLIQPITLDLRDQVRARDAELLGQLRLVPVGADEALVDEVALEPLDGVLERSGVVVARDGARHRHAGGVAHAL